MTTCNGFGHQVEAALATIAGLAALLLISACGGQRSTRAAIAFSSHDPALPGAIFRVYADGCCRKQLTHPPQGTFDYSPSWSPDGKRVALLRQHASGPLRLFIADAKGETPVPIRDHEIRGVGLSWSPDGRQILFGAGDGLRTINLSDGKTTLLAPDSLGAAEGSWSPDGHTIAFVGDGGIYLVDSDGSHIRLLTRVRSPLADSMPAWSPDGEQLAYLQVNTIFFTGFRPRVRAIRANGTRGRTVATLSPESDTNVTWSPDGERIAFSDFDRAAPGIYTVSAAGGRRRLLFSGQTEDISWSRP